MLIVVRVVCLGAVEVDCSGVVDLFALGGNLLVMAVEVQLVVGCVVKLVLWCLNVKGDFL